MVRSQKAKGGPAGGRRYGYKLVGPQKKRRWVPDSYTRTAGRKILEFRQAGWTWEGIYFHFIERGVRTRDGREWSLGAIKRAAAAELKLQAEEPAQAKTDKHEGATT